MGEVKPDAPLGDERRRATPASDRKALLYLASEFADLARGCDEPQAQPTDEHDPEDCEVCSCIADRLQTLISDELRYADSTIERRRATETDIDSFWTAVEHGWDIEPRAYFEEKAMAMGFKSPLEMAVHHMWKRHAKVWPNAELKQSVADTERLRAHEVSHCENCGRPDVPLTELMCKSCWENEEE